MRDSKPRRMIQQQLYARERRGIFRSTEGYDTIARSSGLEPTFIKKALHPFCVYDAPTELATRGEKDGDAYPETMHLLHLENGDILLGRSVYKAVDFTGLRSAFFTHNYIIPAGHEDGSADRYESWLRASFVEQYDIENGTEIAELASLPTERASAIKPSYRSTLALLNIGEKAFKQLLYAVMSAIGAGKKKIYVSLDVPILQLPMKAKQLLGVLYASLPYAFREQLGFITYAKEPQSRKSVHLTFVEQGSLRPGDRSIEKDYTFDFANDRITNVDLDGADQPYLDFAWNNLEQPARADRFFQFADQMLAGMEPERSVAAASYHELCVIYQIEEGNEPLYEAHKSAVLRGLLEYLQPSGAVDSKIRLTDVLLSRFDYEFDRVRQGVVPEPFIVDVFKDYYRIDGKYFEGKLVSFFLSALNNASRQNDQETAASLYAALESSPDLSRAFFGMLLADRRSTGSLFIPLLDKKLQALSGASSVLQLISEWGNGYPVLYSYESFQQLTEEHLLEKLARERYSLPAVSKVLEQLRTLVEGSRQLMGKQRNSDDATDFYQELGLTVYVKALGELDLDRLAKEQLAAASFMNNKDQLQRWNDKLQDPRQKSVALELLALYEWFALPEPTEMIFSRLSPTEIVHVQQAGRRVLGERLDSSEWPRLVLAFLRSPEMDTVNYVELIDYLRQHAADKETIYRFFQWSEKQPEFMRPRGFVPTYTTAIVDYFKSYDRDAFKKRANWKQYFDKTGPSLQAVYKQAEREISSKGRFPFRNPKTTIISSIALLGIILLVVGLVLSNADKVKEGAELPESQHPAVTAPPEPDVLVYAEQTPASEGQEAATSLVFLFKDGAACAAFVPGSLTIAAPGAAAVEYKKLGLTSNCSTNTTNAADPDGDGANKGDAALHSDLPIATDGTTPKNSATPPANVPSSTPVTGSEQKDTNGGFTTKPSNDAASESDNPAHTSEGSDKVQGYPSRVDINLGKQVEIPAESIIYIEEFQYKLAPMPVATQ